MKNVKQIIIILLLSIGSVSECAAQKSLEESILYYNENFILFSNSCELDTAELFMSKEVLGADNNDDFILESLHNDAFSGLEIYTYRQYRWGFKTNSVIKVHTKSGMLRSVTGRLDRSTSFPTDSLIAVSSVFELLKDSLGAMEYVWEGYNIQDDQIIYPEADTFIVTDVLENGDTVWLDYAENEGHFVVLDDTVGFWLAGGPLPTIDTLLEKGQICYSFMLQSRFPAVTYNVVVNATDGHIVSAIEDGYSANGSGATRYNGVRSFNTAWYGPYWIFWERYNLFDHSRGDGIHTMIYDQVGQTPGEALDGNNLWYESKHLSAVSAHWAVQEAWDYFDMIFGRPGFDGEGGAINIVTDLSVSQSNEACNAYFRHNSEKLEFVKGGGGCDPSVSLDIVSHEYTHGVLKYAYFTNPNANTGESGALNESFADIFGTTVEYFVGNSNDPWRIGDDIPNPIQIRDFRSPNNTVNPSSPTLGQPSWYGQPNYWFTPSSPSDHGGTHINSGVQNHWFYLLSEGGPSPQPNNSTVVQGIGREKAALITYRNLTEHLTPYSNYADARLGSILAAVDEFGACSFEVEQTINAWDAVNVTGDGNGLHYDLQLDCDNLSSDYVYALRDLTVACDYSNESSYKSLTAGRILSIGPGFQSNSNMHLRIEPCFAGSGKMEEYPSYEGAGGGDAISISPRSKRPEPKPVLFPNPNDGRFTVQCVGAKLAVIYDMIGRQIMNMERISDVGFYVSNVPRGSYLVRVTLNNGGTETLKAIVR